MLSLKTFTDNYKDLPEESIASFINLATIVEFKKNEVITKTGEISNDFYIIKSGIVRSFYADEKGKEYTRTIFTEGKTTGSLGSLVSGESSKLTYECLTDCVAYKFIYREFLALTEKDNFMLKLYNKMLENIFLMMEARIYELSVLNATQRYLKLKGEIPNIETLIPQYHIASY